MSDEHQPAPASDGETRRTLRARGAGVVASVLAAGVLITYAADSSLPTNALELPGPSAQVVKAFTPQGWAFFTRSPREPDLAAWHRRAGAWVPASVGPNASWRAALGANRFPRAQGVELGLVYGRAAEQGGRWSRCVEETERCLAGTERTGPRAVRNDTPDPTLCGRIGISSTEPVPWAWARSGDTGPMPGKVMVVSVAC